MSVIKANGAGDQSTGFYNGVATQSLRSNQPSSTLLSKTLGTPTTRRRWTISFWLKRTQFGLGVNATNSYNPIMGCDNKLIARFDINDKFQLYDYDGNFDVNLVSTMRFRDPSAWYNIVIVTDIDGQSGNNRMKLYVNGVRQDWSGDDPGDYDPRWNGALSHQLLSDGQTTARFNGYVSDVTFLDGQAIGETNGYLDEFGEVVNGVWIPKSTSSLTFGNNGFKLEFKKDGTGTGGTDTIGADTANTNHFDSSGMDTEDCNMPDSPENNFCTYNPLDAKGNANTFSEGNLKVVVSAQNTNEETRATFGVSSGKWYWEHRLASSTTTVGYFKIGIKSDDESNYWNVRGSDGELVNNGSTTTSSVRFNTAGNVVGVYLDMDNGKWYVSVDGTLQNSADLSAGSGYLHNNISGTVHPYILNASSGGTHTGQGNFGQDSTFSGLESAGGYSDANGNGDFHSSVFSGYLALCTANLPEPIIGPNSDTQANDHFDILTWTATGSRHIVHDRDDGAGVGLTFKPDMIWGKKRTGSNDNHVIVDSTRGVTKEVFPNSTNDEDTNSNGVESFDAPSSSGATDGGFTLVGTGSGSGVWNGNSGHTHVAWNWKANGGTTSSDGNGSITSTVQANTTAGFSIITFTGNDTDDATIGHGVKVNGSAKTPAWIITRNRDDDQSAGGVASHWRAWHQNLSANYVLYLSGTLNQIASTGHSNGYIKTVGSTTYSTHDSNVDSNAVNGSGDAMIAYAWAEVDGYSKFGKYEGNNSSTDGVYVFLGFRPAFVIIKNIDTDGENWHMFDSTRAKTNIIKARLIADDDTAENTNDEIIDFLSNGFKLYDNNAGYNSSATFVYMAFAEQPFKYANAR